MTESCSIMVMTHFVFGIPCDCVWANSQGIAAVSKELPGCILGHVGCSFGVQSPASSEVLFESPELGSVH